MTTNSNDSLGRSIVIYRERTRGEGGTTFYRVYHIRDGEVQVKMNNVWCDVLESDGGYLTVDWAALKESR